MIAGVAKGGTTSLFHYLCQHDDICGSDVKEVDYFGPLRAPDAQLASVDEYRKHFRHCSNTRYRIEASPSYCYAGRPVIEAIRGVLGRPRIIISLRDPVRRFWSAFTFLQSMGRLDQHMTCESYMEWCLAEEEQVGRTTPLAVGRYLEWLPGWLDEFGPDLRLVFAEQLFDSPEEVVLDLIRWLELAPFSLDPAPRNPTASPRSHEVAKISYRAKHVTDRLLAATPRARAALGTIYRRINTTELTKQLPDRAKVRLEDHYRAPTAELAEVLTRHAVSTFPGWLRK